MYKAFNAKHYSIGIADDMISAGLQLTDLNLLDSTCERLIHDTSQERELKETTDRQQFWERQASCVRRELHTSHRKNRRLLHSTMPKHIALLLQSGCQPLVTIMFANIVDFKTLTGHLDAASAITYLNKVATLFDTIADQFDIFKIEIITDAGYMAVAGIHHQSYLAQTQNKSQLSLTSLLNEEDHEDQKSDDGKQILCELNLAEIIAALSLELLCASECIHNPITFKPFGLKFAIIAINRDLFTNYFEYQPLCYR
ncbi:unnamed protein product [Rotaria socialis]|uniref:guanylate cyclase n=2 Tax=Rotaria socialis TaxID=392032 RepID=A0A817Q4J1_9BILA|nr:unnamed protein product [Rotaria socialis]